MIALFVLLMAMETEPMAASPPALIVFSEHHCFGPCPAYRLAIFPSDEYIMCGFFAVNEPGVTIDTLPEGVFNEAFELTETSHLLSEEPVTRTGQECDLVSTDASGMRIEVLYENGEHAAFEWYGGCHLRDGGPGETFQQAREFIVSMRQVLGFEHLVQTPETRASLMRDPFVGRSMPLIACPIPEPAARIFE